MSPTKMTGRIVFWISVVGLVVWTIFMMLGMAHIAYPHGDHTYLTPEYCPTCECVVHEDCWPGKED